MPRNTAVSKTGTVEPRYNEVPRDWQNLFAKTRFRYVEILFHIFSYYWGTKNRSLYQGLRLIYRGSFTYIAVLPASFLCYDNSDVVVTLIITTDFHL